MPKIRAVATKGKRLIADFKEVLLLSGIMAFPFPGLSFPGLLLFNIEGSCR
jgi:hypothetical protein